MTKEERALVDAFKLVWLKSQGYEPAAFQKAIALQRFRRGQSVDEIVTALVAMRT